MVLGEVTVVILGCGAKVDEFKILIIYTLSILIKHFYFLKPIKAGNAQQYK